MTLMAAFGLDEDNTLDWGILQDGGISVYRNRAYLNEDIEWLKKHHYTIDIIDCRTWTSDSSLHDSLQQALKFPAYYGRNLNAMLDCLRDVDVPVEGGFAIVLESFDEYSRISSDARAVLNIFGIASRYFLLTGRRLLVLVQSDDPSMHFEGLACVSTQWNRREWLNKDREV